MGHYLVAESGIRTTRPFAYEANELTSAPSRISILADSVGFEPTEPFGSLVFKTSAIDHSTNYPNLAEEVGFEPTTTPLTAESSTN